MAEQLRLTVTLHWRDPAGVQRQDVTLPDQTPQELIPALVQRLELAGDREGVPVGYRLRRDGEQGPALRSRERLSRQLVSDGSKLWLAPELLTVASSPKRCLLRLPDGSELAVPPRGHGLTRTWLMGFLHLYNPEAYAREVERFAQGQSSYRYVSDKQPHCVLRPADAEGWMVAVERDDVLTERAAEQTFERVPTGVPLRLDNGARLRLGGERGLELSVVIL
jgi:hypothetical protein